MASRLLQSHPMRVKWLLLGVLPLFAGVARAQYGYSTLTVTVDQNPTQWPSGSAPPLYVTKAGCREALTGSVTPGVNGVQLGIPEADVGATAFWATDSSCGTPDGGATFNLTLGYVDTQLEYVVNVNGEQVVSEATGLSDPCDDPSEPNGTLYLCVALPNVGSVYYPSTPPWYMQLIYDMRPPPAPADVTATAGDGQLSMDWSFVSNGITPDHFLVYTQKDTFGGCDGGIAGGALYENFGADGGPTGSPGDPGDPSNWSGATQQAPAGVTSAMLSNLENETCYDLSARAFYVDGTPGDYSQPVAASPIEVLDYWRLAHQAGLQDPGGFHCASASGGLPPLALALAGLLFLRRRRSR